MKRESEDYMSFADNLKVVRNQKKLSQEQLAEILGVSRQAVSKSYELKYNAEVEVKFSRVKLKKL